MSRRAFTSLRAAQINSSVAGTYEDWEANWGFAVQDVFTAGGGRIVQTHNGFFVRRHDTYRASPTLFAGDTYATLEGDHPGIPVGWVVAPGAKVYPSPATRGAVRDIARFTRIHVFGTFAGPDGRMFARIGEDEWMRADQLRWISPEPAPDAVNTARNERWIDVDLSTQTLVAYEGTRPMYATLVSTGQGRFATQPGVFRIWGRFLTQTMDNTEATNLPNHFRLGDVPYVQFFDGDRGLHGVYWHDGFGYPRSHGCVNMAPHDAQYVFSFTSHPLPEGWASRAIPEGQGTVVRVRGTNPQRT